MMTESNKASARKAIQKVANTYGVDVVEIVFSEVVSVDVTTRTCIVKPISGKSDTQITDVGLQADAGDGEVKIPSVGSTVVICMSTMLGAFILSSQDYDFISFKGGNFGGLVKVQTLTTKLNNIENKIDQLITSINSWIPVPNDGGAALKVSLTSWLSSSVVITNISDIENPNIKHGDK